MVIRARGGREIMQAKSKAGVVNGLNGSVQELFAFIDRDLGSDAGHTTMGLA
jgi:hypothetical protein